MRSKLLTRVRGYVLVEVRGEQAENFVNLLLHKQIECWNIRRTERGRLSMELYVSDFFRLRPLLKQTGCRLNILKKVGFPFRLKRLSKRKGFIAGLLLFFILLYGMSMVVWDVQVEGLDTLSEDAVMLAAKETGIYKMQWKFKLKNPSELSAQLVRKLDGVSWVGVSVEGTKVNIKVVESARAEEKTLKNPRNLIATHDAVVSYIFAEKGRPVVKTNTHVKKGDVLISGIVGDEGNYRIVVAEGEVRGWVWYEYKVTVPMIQKRKVYTGNTSHHRYFVIGNRGLKISGYGEEKYSKFETDEQRYTLQWRKFTLPIGWSKETVREVEYDVRNIEPEEAIRIGLEHARSEVLMKAGENAKITDEKVLSQDIGEREVTLRLLFEVDQPIAKEQAIVHDPMKDEGNAE